MMMGLSLCWPMVCKISSTNSLPAPAKPMRTVGFTCRAKSKVYLWHARITCQFFARLPGA